MNGTVLQYSKVKLVQHDQLCELIFDARGIVDSLNAWEVRFAIYCYNFRQPWLP